MKRHTPRELRVALILFGASLLVFAGCHEVHLDLEEKPGDITILDDLYSVSVPDEKHAVAVGYYGAVYRTEDGGQTWSKGRSGDIDARSIYSVSMANAQQGWAVGMRGLILRTEDGGQNWERQPNLKEKEGSHLFAVTATDANTAWAVGSWGTRILTTDGGKTWVDDSFTVDEQHPQFVWLPPVDQERVRRGEKVYEDVGLTDVTCNRPPSTRCWLIGEFGYVFYSDDRGTTWQRSKIEGEVEVPKLDMAYNKLELSEANRQVLADFAEAIADKEHLNVAIESFTNAREIRDFGNPEDPFELFEILEARGQEVRTVLEDAGILSDRLRMRGQPPWDYEDFLEDDPDFLDRYLAGRRMETPGIKVRVLQNPYLYTVRFRDDENGMIAGLGGVVLVTADGGRTWSYQNIDRKQALFAARPVGARAIAVGEKGLVRVSTNGGRTWMEPKSGTFPEVFTYMRDIAFDPTGRVGFIVGQTGQILRSEDGGFEWRQVLPERPTEESDAAT